MSSRGTHAVVVAALGLACAAAQVGCSETTDTNDVVPSTAGAFQPKANGQRTTEAAACEAIANAEDARRSSLGCGSVQRAPCPEYIRPAGGAACYEYDQGTVDACVGYYAGFERCEQFTNNPCVVTAYPTGDCSSSGGAGGSGGSAGAGATGGTAGSAGVGGSGGTAGSAGTGGTTGGTGGAGGTSGGAAGAATGGAAGSGGTGGTT